MYISGLIDIRSGIELFPIDSKCEGYLEVCCRHPDWSGQPVETPPPQPPKQEYVAKCGRHNLNGVGVRIQVRFCDMATNNVQIHPILTCRMMS